MNSTCKFAKYFYKHLNEDNGSGAGGAFGDGPSTHNLYDVDRLTNVSNTPGDARVATPLGKKKKVQVQRRNFPPVEGEERRKKKKKKKKNWMKGAVKKPGALNAAAGAKERVKLNIAQSRLQRKLKSGAIFGEHLTSIGLKTRR